ncbi:hypothetical protein D3C71_1487850 [compost metagenome]
MLGLLVDGHQLRGNRHEGAPLLVQGDQFSLTQEQLAFQIGFQCAHLQAHGYLRQCNPLARSRKRSLCGNREKGTENSQTRHKSFSYSLSKTFQLLHNYFYHHNQPEAHY